MDKKGKLELTWVGKNDEKELEPRILVEDKEKSYGDQDTGNMLVHGDNLLALKAIEQEYSGKIKCIYIDPAYNTGSAFEYYDDGLEHSQWLNMMEPRLIILKKLLSKDGLIFVQIDDNEMAYLKVMMDQIFGRENFVNCIVVKMSEPSGIKMAHVEHRLPKLKEYILMYKKEEIHLNEFKVRKPKWDNEYKTEIQNITLDELTFVKTTAQNEERTDSDVQKCQRILDNATYKTLAQIYKEKGIKTLKEQNEYNFKNAYRIFQTVSMGGGTTKAINESRNCICKNIFFYHITSNHKMYIIKGDYDLEKKKPRIQVLFADDYLMYNPCDLWTDIKTTGLDNEGAGVDFKNSKKPESLIQRVLAIASNEGDIVLDSFLGSGTTAAVAQKMHRHWIGIELGDHAYTHCKVRLDKVVDGEQSGISKYVNWQGGGGYKFYELADPLLVKNKVLPVYQINPSYTWDMVCEAICKIEGFTYQPEGEFQGHSSENRFIHITQEYVNSKYVMSIMKNLGEKQSLLIYCKKFQADIRLPENVEIKKIPKDLLDKCNFDEDGEVSE